MTNKLWFCWIYALQDTGMQLLSHDHKVFLPGKEIEANIL